MQVNQICDIPIILMGDMWKGLIKWIERYPLDMNFLSKKDMGLLFYAKDCDEAIKMIDMANKEFKSGNKNYCLNYEKYKLYWLLFKILILFRLAVRNWFSESL